jgi:integrase
MEFSPKYGKSRRRGAGNGPLQWQLSRSILVRSRSNPGQVIWKGECRRCAHDRFLIRLQSGRKDPSTPALSWQVCACAPTDEVPHSACSPADAVKLLGRLAKAHRQRFDRVNLRRFIEKEWLPERRGATDVAGSTFNTDARRARKIVSDEAVAEKDLRALNLEDCQSLVYRLVEAGLARATILGIIGTLKTILFAAKRAGRIDVNPMAEGMGRVRVPKLTGKAALDFMRRRRERFWHPEQVHGFLALASRFPVLPENFVLFAVAVVLGLRPAEICALQWTDYSEDFTRLTVWRSIAEQSERDRKEGGPAYGEAITKERTEHTLPVPDVLSDIIRRFNREQGNPCEGYLVVNKNGIPLTPRSLSDRWRSWRKKKDGGRAEKGFFLLAQAMVREMTEGKVDLHFITPYGHRHTCATYILTFAAPEDAAKALRHSRSTGTSLIYRNYGEVLEQRSRARASTMSQRLGAGIRHLIETETSPSTIPGPL